LTFTLQLRNLPVVAFYLLAASR